MTNMQGINWEKFKQPIILDRKEFDESRKGSKEYIFKNELDQLMDILEGFTTLSDKDQSEEMSKNIAIAGERGSGKTSLLKSLKNGLSEKYHVFEIIGPEMLSSNLSIVDIFISMLRDTINKKLDKESFNTRDLTALNKDLKSIMGAVAIDKQGAHYFKDGHSDTSILESLGSRVNLNKKLKNLLRDVLASLNQEEVVKKKDFVLIIDDLDLVKNHQIARLLKDIQLYLDKNLIIIFAYRQGQLVSSLFEDYFSDNRHLLDRKIIDDREIFSQINQFLLKLVPLGNRLSLFTQNDLLNKKMSDVLKSIGLGLGDNLEIIENNQSDGKDQEDKKNSMPVEEMTVEKWFYQLIFKRTDLYIEPIDSRENTHLLLPQSLREIIQVAEIFNKMKVLKKGSSQEDFLQGLIDNLSELKKYINYKVTSQFGADSSKSSFFEEWELAKPYSKNHLTYSYIYNAYYHSDAINKTSEYPFNLSNREEYNLTLGDILATIEEYKRLFQSSLDYHFAYLIKINYSIYLSSKLFQGIKEIKENDDILSRYSKTRGVFLRKLCKSDNVITDVQTKELKKWEEKYTNSIEKITEEAPEITEYLQTINTSFMPEEFNFLDFVSTYNKEDYILQLPSVKDFEKIVYKEDKKEKEVNKEDYYLFLQDFISSEWPAKGDVAANIKSGRSQFRYRKLYTFLPIPSQMGNRSYIFNFLTAPTKSVYLLQTINSYWNNSNKRDFLYKNTLHTDIFIRQNYARRSNKGDEIKYTLEKVNEILEGNKKDNLYSSFLKSFFYEKETEEYFNPLYNKDKFNKIIEIIKSFLGNDKTEVNIISTKQDKLNREDVIKSLNEKLGLKIGKNEKYGEIANKLDSEVKDIKRSEDQEKNSQIIEKIKEKKVTEQDIKDLAEIYKKYKPGGEAIEAN